MAAIHILYCGIAGGAIGSLFDSPVSGFGQGLKCGSIVYVANLIFGSIGFYLSIAYLAIRYIAKIGVFAEHQIALEERISAVAAQTYDS